MVRVFHKLTIEVPAEKVYEALTTLEGLKGWWMGASKGDPGKVDGDLEFGVGEEEGGYYHKMKVSELDENKKVAWKMVENKGPNDEVSVWDNTDVIFELEEKQLERLDGKTVTVLFMKHENWPEESDETNFYADCNYHWAYFLFSLKKYVEEGQGMPM